ncbi:MAG TPA: YciI family protein [Streptosporangiaceae bacterium]|jgi:hypothetical protein|nr:YciI family protein [Streptosporangiaceae bacterium]
MELEAFELVFLRRPENPAAHPDEVLERIQEEHLAYLASLRASGQAVTSGPVMDQADGSLRGVTIFRTGSLDESRRLAEADPAVQAGRLVPEIMTWLCPPGTMTKPGRQFTVP